MPLAPSLYGKEGIQGEPITGTPGEELHDFVAYYTDVADEPGEILVQIDHPKASEEFLDACHDVGVTWLLTGSLLADDAHETNLDRVRRGPPA